MKASVRVLLCAAPVIFMLGCPFQLPPPCAGDADCVDQVCNVTTGACVDCLTDANCAAGQVCTSGVCEAAPECTVDADCAAGEVCTNGECAAAPAPGCTVDTDCAEGEVCTAGECVAGGPVGDPVAGEAFFTANTCAVCHAADATGGIGPNIQAESAAEIFARLSGAEAHMGGTVDGVTEQDSLDLEAWLGSL